MKDTLIEFETAKLAEEKGFDWKVLNQYSFEGVVNRSWVIRTSFNRHCYNFNGDQYTSNCFSAPTQSLLQKWLRDEHTIIVFVPLTLYSIAREEIMKYTAKVFTFDSGECYHVSSKSHEQALEYGLINGLKLIK